MLDPDLQKITSAGRETGVSRHVVWVQLMTSTKPRNTIMQWWYEGFQGVPMMARNASLSDSYTSDRCCFSRLGSS